MKSFTVTLYRGVQPQGRKREAKKEARQESESKYKMAHCQGDYSATENQMAAQSCGPSPGTVEGTVSCPSSRWKREQFICWLLPLPSLSFIKVCSINTNSLTIWGCVIHFSRRLLGRPATQWAQSVQGTDLVSRSPLVCGGSSGSFRIIERSLGLFWPGSEISKQGWG